VDVGTENRSLIAGFAVAFLAALFFAALAHAVMHGDTESFDRSVRNKIHSWATPIVTRAMRGVTELGAPFFLVPLGAVFVWRLYAAGRPRAAVLFAIAALGAEACDQALKYSFQRPRPEVFFGMMQPLTYSFPSGHSVESCCFYGALAAILSVAAPSRPRKAVIWFVAAALTLAIGFSRVYLGVHYPTDVVGGYAVAIVWAALVHTGYQVWLRHRATGK
jgi:undecaprenyl-diphosphatase